MAKALQLAIARYTEYMGENETPPCFSREEYSAWLRHEQEIKTLPIRAWVCRDCTKQFQYEMKGVKKCIIPDIDVEKIAD